MIERPKPFIFCVHAHQPVGNFEHVLQEAYAKCYKPFVEVLAKHPKSRVVMHLSGSLLDWLKMNQPAFLGILKELQDQGVLEILGGAYYEPVFSEIPVNDLLDQIRLMQENQKAVFGKVPKGVWLTERVWTPELLPVLSQAGIEFTVLDDCHFERAGHHSTGYYRLSQEAHKLDLFSSSKNLRYLIPFSHVEDAVSGIRTAAESSGSVAVFADDCEKFGLWPKTAAWVYGQQWLDKFLSAIEKSADIRMMTFGEARAKLDPSMVSHVPEGSYEEMADWAGGSFDNFGRKYAESLYMKERAWETSRELAQKVEIANRDDAPQMAIARTALYKAQCNCSYWHGVFGGLYLHHLRSATFENLIQAEEALHNLRPTAESDEAGRFTRVALPSGTRWRARQVQVVSFWNGSCGGALEELDFLPQSVNLMCTLRRQQEPYHEVVTKNGQSRLTSGFSIHQLLGVKERGLEKALIYDVHRRLSFMDHFFTEKINAKTFESQSFRECGDFVGAPYETDENGGSLVLTRQGVVSGHVVRLTKDVRSIGEQKIRVSYRIQNMGPKPIQTVWGVEFNFSIGNENGTRSWDKEGVRDVRLVDSWRDIPVQIVSQGAFRTLMCPIETVSGSESGLGRTYQGLSLLWQRDLALDPGQVEQETFDLQVGALQ